MKDKIVLITGSNSGIGKATATALANMGATIVMLCRDIKRSEIAQKEIIEQSGNKNIDLIECDLSSLASVRKAAQTFKSKYNKLDVLINNAGGWFTKRQTTIDGYEMTLAVNHIGHFILTSLLMDTLINSAPSRIINVSSAAHMMGHIDFDDLMAQKSYNTWRSYGTGKLANILFTKELSRKLIDKGVTANCLHPGVVNSNFFSQNNWGKNIFAKLFRFFLITPEKGAQTSVFLASSPDVQNISGQYFKKKKIVSSSKESNNADVAIKLWEISEKLTAIK